MHLSIVVWRDSVCLTDDIKAPHEMEMEIALDTSLDCWLAQLQSHSYLASIAGDEATWILVASRPHLCPASLAGNNAAWTSAQSPLAVVAQQ